MISGNIQLAHAHQKMNVMIGAAENGRGRSCILVGQLTVYVQRLCPLLSNSYGVCELVTVAQSSEHDLVPPIPTHARFV